MQACIHLPGLHSSLPDYIVLWQKWSQVQLFCGTTLFLREPYALPTLLYKWTALIEMNERAVLLPGIVFDSLNTDKNIEAFVFHAILCTARAKWMTTGAVLLLKYDLHTLQDMHQYASFALVVLCTSVQADQSHRSPSQTSKKHDVLAYIWLTAEDIGWQHHKSVRLSHKLIISWWHDLNVTRLKTHLSDSCGKQWWWALKL